MSSKNDKIEFGSKKVVVPEKMMRGGKQINTLTKGKNPTQRNKEQSVKLVAKEGAKNITVVDTQPKKKEPTKTEMKKKAVEERKEKKQKRGGNPFIFAKDVLMILDEDGDLSIKQNKKHRITPTKKASLMDLGYINIKDNRRKLFTSEGDKLRLSEHFVNSVGLFLLKVRKAKYEDFTKRLQRLLDSAFAEEYGLEDFNTKLNTLFDAYTKAKEDRYQPGNWAYPSPAIQELF